VSVPYIVGNDKDGLPPALLRANNGVIEMAEHYGATFIPKGEFDLINQIVAIADDNSKPTE